ncbi:MAG: hypothetical protein A2Y70_03110 [Candidatus Aminicenantes bacterium RBG_13_64_14]|nr:MAG: hypothetical protein A2Y70_03110 [Candidatus Aminicenantes bacterium RBG_13_64_14]
MAGHLPPDPVVIIPGFLLTPGRFKEMRVALRALCPGACFAPEVIYMSVAGKAVRGVHHSCMREDRRWYGSADVVAEWWKAWLST